MSLVVKNIQLHGTGDVTPSTLPTAAQQLIRDNLTDVTLDVELDLEAVAFRVLRINGQACCWKHCKNVHPAYLDKD